MYLAELVMLNLLMIMFVKSDLSLVNSIICTGRITIQINKQKKILDLYVIYIFNENPHAIKYWN